MTFSGRTIAKNAGVLLVSQLITWGLTFLLTIFQPRYLGPGGVGQLQLAWSLWAIVAVIAALGTDTLVTREIARAPEKLNELISTAMVIRGLIFLVGALGMAVYVWLAGYPPGTVRVIWIIGLASLVAQLTGTYEAGLKGLERMEYTSLAAVTSSAILSILCIALLLLGYGVMPIAGIGILANAASLAILYYFLRRRFSFQLCIHWELVRPLLRTSLPYFLVTAGIVLYHQVDTVIISLLVDEETIGWYGAANRLYGTLLFLPNVFITALFPALNRAYAESHRISQKLAQKSLDLLILVSVPIGLGMMAIANPLVVLLFGPAFTNSGPVLAVRGILLILTYVNMLLGLLLISIDRQKPWAAVILACTFATIPLDLILIPWTENTFANGALGGSLSFAVTEIGMTAAGFALLPKDIFSRENGKAAAKMLTAGLGMTAITWILRDAFILVPMILGAATYIGMILLLRAVPKGDLDTFFELGGVFIQRLRGRFSRAAELKG